MEKAFLTESNRVNGLPSWQHNGLRMLLGMDLNLECDSLQFFKLRQYIFG